MLMPMPKLWLLLLDGHHRFMSRESRFDSWIMSHMWTILTQILSLPFWQRINYDLSGGTRLTPECAVGLVVCKLG
jgi:hypothetical protein